MKKILSIFALCIFALSATAQTTIIDYAAVWAEKQQQIRLEVAIHATASNILDTPADSIFAAKAVGVILSSNMDSYKRRYTREAIKRKVNPNALGDTQLVNGVRALFIAEYWAEQLRNGLITATEYYAETQ